MIDLIDKQCIVYKGKVIERISDYHFSGEDEFALATHIMKNPSWKQFKIEFIGKGKIYSIAGKPKSLKSQPYLYFWKILGEKEKKLK